MKGGKGGGGGYSVKHVAMLRPRDERGEKGGGDTV